MAKITSRQQLIDYCLRKLGSPVIRVNVSDDQLDDRVDEALQMYAEYHFNGTAESYVKYQITPQDQQNTYLTLPENIIGVVEMFPLTGFALMGGSDMFNIRYQIALNDLYTIAGTNLVPYAMTMTHLNTMNELLIGRTPTRYTRQNGNKFYIDTNWDEMIPGTWVIIKAYEVIDPNDFEGIYDDMWLKQYVTALIKEQWGVNLSKFQGGMPLPGGMVFNGAEILQQGKAEVQQALDDLETKYTMPPLMRLA